MAFNRARWPFVQSLVLGLALRFQPASHLSPSERQFSYSQDERDQSLASRLHTARKVEPTQAAYIQAQTREGSQLSTASSLTSLNPRGTKSTSPSLHLPA